MMPVEVLGVQSSFSQEHGEGKHCPLSIVVGRRLACLTTVLMNLVALSICGSFGAVIFIVALALGPFAQQVATYRSHSIEAPTPAAIPAALNYTGVLPGDGSSSESPPL